MLLRRAMAYLRPVGLAILTGLLVCGCASPPLNSARANFYAGRLDRAEGALTNAPVLEKDQVLFLMERGTIRQAAGKYEESAKDFIRASDSIDKFETYSVSKGASSWVVNDTVENYRGTPYERTMLHDFTAQDHLAEGDWDNAAVESRRIIKTLDPKFRGNYPEDAYSRYMAGFGLEMIDDDSNAELQYKEASRLAKGIALDPTTGHFIPRLVSTNSEPVVAATPEEKSFPHELVCFVLLGRTLREVDAWENWYSYGPAPYAELYCEGKYLGRSYNLTDTAELAVTTEKLQAMQKAAKTIARVALKETVAYEIEKENEALGALTRLILLGLFEQPDVRRWETLPRWLQVARVPCPADMKNFQVVVKSPYGTTSSTILVDQPISSRRNIFVSFCRDIVPAPPR